MEPFYPDQTRGIPKTSESRAIESVMNALVLATRDAESSRLSADTKTAFGVMWPLQMKTGPQNGAWTWLNFGYEPWESPTSLKPRWYQKFSMKRSSGGAGVYERKSKKSSRTNSARCKAQHFDLATGLTLASDLDIEFR